MEIGIVCCDRNQRNITKYMPMSNAYKKLVALPYKNVLVYFPLLHDH